ncbi:MAG: adenosylcobinamide amidohydrolase [Firmicutes bacterium]|nr:adenosylcobinamide amidohydrolase [Bacillota bacterium]
MLEEVPLFNKQVSMDGIKFYMQSRKTFLVSSASPLKVLGSTVLGGELRWASHIINHSVDKDYRGSDPEEDLRRVAEKMQLGRDVLGMMTAVSVTHTVLSHGKHYNLTVATLCTAGISNPGVAGSSVGKLLRDSKQGTINLIVLIDGNLTDAAMVNAVMTATEAKTRALFKAKISLPGGERITGTTTDAMVVACTARGETVFYSGTATDLGYLIGHTVYKAVRQGVDSYLLSTGSKYKAANKKQLLN